MGSRRLTALTRRWRYFLTMVNSTVATSGPSADGVADRHRGTTRSAAVRSTPTGPSAYGIAVNGGGAVTILTGPRSRRRAMALAGSRSRARALTLEGVARKRHDPRRVRPYFRRPFLRPLQWSFRLYYLGRHGDAHRYDDFDTRRRYARRRHRGGGINHARSGRTCRRPAPERMAFFTNAGGVTNISGGSVTTTGAGGVDLFASGTIFEDFGLGCRVVCGSGARCPCRLRLSGWGSGYDRRLRKDQRQHPLRSRRLWRRHCQSQWHSDVRDGPRIRRPLC